MTKENARILIIEDESDIIEFLRYTLEREGFSVVVARDGDRGLTEALIRKPALILLDIMLPGMDGIEVCRALKSRPETKSIPVIMVTAKEEESDEVLGLGIGADDYVTKPFSPRKLVARIRAALRRIENKDVTSPHIEFGPLAIDSMRHEVTLRGKSLDLTLAEFRLLHTLVSQPGRVFSRDQLLEKQTAGECIVLDRNVDVHIGAIRKKLGIDGELVATVRGVGYKLRD